MESASLVARFIGSVLDKPLSLRGVFVLIGALTLIYYSGKISGEIQFLVVAAMVWMMLAYKRRSISTASLITAIFLLPFDIGRGMSKTVARVPLSWGGEREFTVWFIVSYADVIFFLLAAAAVFVSIHRPRSWLRRADYFMVALVGWAIVTTFSAQDRPAAILGLLALLKGVMVYVVVRIYTVAKPSNVRLVVVALTWVILFQGSWSLYQLIRGGPTGHFFDIASFKTASGLNDLGDTAVFRASGTLLDPNVFAMYIAMLLPSTITNLLHTKTTTRRIFYGGASLVGFIAVMLSASRTGWIVLTVIFSLLVIHNAAAAQRLFWRMVAHKVGALGAIALLALASFVVVPTVILPRLTSFYALLREGGVVKARLDLNKEAFVIIQNAPIFGVGLNNSVLQTAKNNMTGISQSFLAEVHNLYLLVAAELGVPGLILWLFLFRESMVRSRRRELPIEHAVRLGIVAYLLFGFSVPSFVRGAQFPTLMMLLALRTYWNGPL